jgi:PAS domain S-box-containing protein
MSAPPPEGKMKANRDTKAAPRTGLRLALAFVFLAIVIATAGYFYYSRYADSLRIEIGNQLFAIGQLKANQLEKWRAERLANGRLLSLNTAFAARLSQYLEDSTAAGAQKDLLAWLASYMANAEYDQIRLLDALGATRLSVPSSLPPASSAILERLPEALQSSQPTFVDFYRGDVDQAIHLAILVPIRSGQPGGQVLGVVALRIDPAVYLYPFISRWPTPSTTAETLLIRRDGDDALFLNELLFQENTALTLRIPLRSQDVPAVKAALGETGIVEGNDYRGVRVIADVRAVPDSPWFVVSRMDWSEVYAPLRERLWQTVALVGVALLGAGTSLAALWRHREAKLYRDRAEMSEALQLSDERFTKAFQTSPYAITFTRAEDGAFVEVNEAFSSMTGFTREEAVTGSSVGLNLWVNEEDRHGVVAALRAGQAVAGKEYQFRTKSGEVITGLFSAQMIQASRELCILSSINDITDLKRAEHERERAVKDLKRSNKELEQFAYVASHDLQEPLRMVSSYVQLLAQRYEGQLDDKAQKYIAYAVDGALRMQQLIEDLLVYSRAGARGGSLESVDSGSALAAAIQNLTKTIEESGAVITHDELPVVRANAPQLTQVFQNLLSNAIKFHGENPPRVHVSAEDKGHEWVFSVKDHGIGIDPQYKDRVFVIFQRLHTRQEYPGTGIGLAVCQRIVERHGGRVWFESEPGMGSTFYFSVPE